MNRMIHVLSLAVLCAGTQSACGTGEASLAADAASQPPAPLPVEFVVPRYADIAETYSTTAAIASDADAPVLARVPGEVVEILVEEGERVQEGQVLARLDGERLRLQMLMARASLDKAAGEYERFLRLHERGLVSAASFEDLAFDVDALKAAYELMQLNFDYTNIRAPIAGVVSSRDVKIGSHIATGQQVFRINDTSKLVAHLHIPQTELTRIAARDAVLVEVDAMPGHRFDASIERISPTIDPRNGTFRATVYIDNTESLLAPGMFSRFSIACAIHNDALVVPSRALVREDDEDVVYVIADGAAARRIVTVGIESGGVTEILDGLDQADRVVVTGQSSLRDGSKVIARNGADGVAG